MSTLAFSRSFERLSLKSRHHDRFGFWASTTTSRYVIPTTLKTIRNVASNARHSTKQDDDNPSQFVSGLTKEQVETNPQIAAFLKANFWQKEGSESRDGFMVPPEILKEYGYDVTDLTVESLPSSSLSIGKQYGQPKVDAGLGSLEQQALNIRKIHSYLRTEEGTRECHRLREEQLMIPGILYGSDSNLGILSIDKKTRTLLKTPWPEFQRELDRYHRKFESRVYDLTIYEDESDSEGTIHRVVPRDVQRHPVQGKIYCANFLRYHPGRPLKIPIKYINQEESPALKRDGYIVPVNKYVECIVDDGVPIPEALELECTGVELKEVIRMDRIIFPDGVRPSQRVDVENFVVGPVYGGRSGAVEEDADDSVKAAAAESENK